jgi:hypothetical protein
MIPPMGMQISGKLHVINDSQQITERFRKREFVLELAENDRYPQLVIFQLTGDRCENLDGFEVGNEVRVEFSLRGREWTSPKGDVKYFNSLDVWSIDRLSGSVDRGEEPPFPTGPPPGGDGDLVF